MPASIVRLDGLTTEWRGEERSSERVYANQPCEWRQGTYTNSRYSIQFRFQRPRYRRHVAAQEGLESIRMKFELSAISKYTKNTRIELVPRQPASSERNIRFRFQDWWGTQSYVFGVRVFLAQYALDLAQKRWMLRADVNEMINVLNSVRDERHY